MKIAFTIVLVLHALIHVLGFLKAFSLAELKAFKQEVAKVFGVLWLLATFLMGAFAIAYFTSSPWSAFLGWLALILSQVLIVRFWKDAKAGTVGNLLLLYVLIMG